MPRQDHPILDMLLLDQLFHAVGYVCFEFHPHDHDAVEVAGYRVGVGYAGIVGFVIGRGGRIFDRFDCCPKR